MRWMDDIIVYRFIHRGWRMCSSVLRYEGGGWKNNWVDDFD